MLPENMRHLFNVEKNGTIVMSGQYFDSPSDLARETAYKVFYSPDKQQELLLSSMLEQRHQLADIIPASVKGQYAEYIQIYKYSNICI